METVQLQVDFHWVIYQTQFFVLIFSFNIFLAITATLGNTLILIALHKVSSIHPPTKFLLRCLAMTDFCVGVIVQPLFVAFLMQIASGKWLILHLTLSTFNFTFCGFSFATATVISVRVDRLLALLLGLRYRHTVTLRRVRCLVVCLILIGIVNGLIYCFSSRNLAYSTVFVVIITSLFLSVFSHGKIFFKLRQHQAQVRHVGHVQANRRGIPLNIERYKKIVCTIAWVQLALVSCYFPMFIFLILATTTDWYKTGSIFYVSALTVVYFNSTLNPILFCWKLREVREAVKTKLKQIRCFSS